MPVIINGTTGITNVNGSAAAPAETGTDTDTGIVYGTNTITLATNGTAGLNQDALQNVGVGITPSAWGSNTALQMAGPSMWGSSGVSHWSTNTYFDGANYKYLATGAAMDYYQYIGGHVFRASDSGTAGATVSTFANLIAVTKGQSLALQGASSQTGTGITFPATQSASSDANTLDDYEEGTFTAPLYFGGNNVGMTGTFAGTYTKIGNLVTIKTFISVTAKGSSTGNATVGGLPFTPATIVGLNQYQSGTIYVAGGAITQSAGTIIQPNVSGTHVDMNFVTTITGSDGNLGNGSFAATGSFWMNFTYQTT